MATHSSILAWRIPWTEKPGRLGSTGSLGFSSLFVWGFFFACLVVFAVELEQCLRTMFYAFQR